MLMPVTGASGGDRTRIFWVEARRNYQTTTDAELAGQEGFEPSTIRLTAERTTAVLLTLK